MSTGNSNAASAFNVLKRELEADGSLSFVVPDRLSNPHPLIVAAKADLAQKHKAWNFEGMIFTQRGILDIRVSPENASRALRFMDSFIKLLKARGHDILVDTSHSYAVIKGEKIRIACREKSRKVVTPDGNWNRTTYHANGILSFKAEGVASGKWKDGAKSLEGQMSTILAKLEVATDQFLERQKDWKRHWAEIKEKERLQKEFEERQDKELEDFKTLLNEAARWQHTEMLRAYIAAMEKQLAGNVSTNKDAEWIAWARNKLAWYDPSVNAEDELLSGVDMRTLAFERKKSGW